MNSTSILITTLTLIAVAIAAPARSNPSFAVQPKSLTTNVAKSKAKICPPGMALITSRGHPKCTHIENILDH